MKIIVAGTGYVGLVHAAVCSEYGHEVYAYDIDPDKIKAFSTGLALTRLKHFRPVWPKRLKNMSMSRD